MQKQVRSLEDDVRERAAATTQVDDRLRAEHAEARRVGRTASSFGEWRDSQVTQAAVAWVLGTVFVRFCEDNRLVDEAWFAGPGDRLREAGERQTDLLVRRPELNDRDWLLAAFDHLAGLPAVAALFDQRHNPLYRLAVSADGAEALLAFWRRRREDGALVHDFTDPDLSTRFLGDLYQDLSEAARKQYALLQTPDFVEELILDLTLDPAIETFGLEGLRLIDPTCGSGHFLLGAFDRLLEAWTRQSPGLPVRDRVAKALGSIHGVDVNPFATAIARFRLTVAALKAEGVTRLAEAPGHRLHLGTGDSLLHGKTEGGELFDSGLGGHLYGVEDLDQHPGILQRGRYHVVVGNPPYITVKDKALNEAYRAGYQTCSGKYALSVPFAELLFKLAVTDGDRPGYVGQITSNSFMKREFGKKLIEQFLPSQDLTHVIDTSGAYIPGHGTPTLILVGRRRHPRSGKLRAVLGIRGEPSAPVHPARGLVWRSIVDHLGRGGFENEYISVADLPRARLATHPWSLSGGGAEGLKALIEQCPTVLSARTNEVGIVAVLGEEEAFETARHCSERTVQLVVGEAIRDYSLTSSPRWWPYGDDLSVRPDASNSRWMWPFRRLVAGYLMFGKTREERGMEWFEYGMLARSKLRTPLAISFAEVATHNHFVLDRGGKVFKQSAPVIKLSKGATEDEHMALLEVLNSSTACFWLRQVCGAKGGSGIGRGIQPEDWMERYNFNSSNVQNLPLPAEMASSRARDIEGYVRRMETSSPEGRVAAGVVGRDQLAAARVEYESARQLAISAQEELDWDVYRRYGILDEDLVAPSELPDLRLGERAFEIRLARMVAGGEAETAWFERHRSTPITDIPDRWPESYRELVERRMELIETHPHLRLLERPDCKRRWADDPWEVKQERALRGWLLDRLEDESLWRDATGRPLVQSVAQLAGRVASDQQLLEVLELWADRPVADPAKELARLVADEHVPYLAALRFKPSGLRKREEWEHTWALQRREDAGETVDVPVPPKYTTADFLKTSYWRHRGKLDVPKERFISYPGAERGADTSLVLGWAGWDHAEQAMALATLVLDRQRQDAWEADRLTPLLAGVAELEPWVHQWHGEVDPRMGMSPAQAVTATLEQQLARLHLTRADLAAWRPAAPARGRRPRTTDA
nr:BREX-2 system adenine-specific DNA-methyltransferase PglX [Nocardioides perillae]